MSGKSRSRSQAREEERVVPEEDVVGPGRVRKPSGRRLSSLDPGCRLALEERRSAVPGPADLRREEQDDRARERGPVAEDRDEPGGERRAEEGQHEDEVPRLGRGGLADPSEPEQKRGGDDDAADEERGPGSEPPQAEHREREDRDEKREKAGRSVARGVCEVAEHRQSVAPADARVESFREHPVREPERRRGERHDRQGGQRPPRSRARENKQALRCEDERPVGMARDRCQGREPPERPPPPPAVLDSHEQRQVRERAREEEQAVHTPVDAVEEHEPTGRSERRRHERDLPAREARRKRRQHRHARNGEERRGQAQGRRSAAEVDDEPRHEEVERRAPRSVCTVWEEPAE